jgi:sugar phosphate isomerase/epimerase
MKHVGIIQGRLSTPVDNQIQAFPRDTWRQEFDKLSTLGLSHIEWIITDDDFLDNPLMVPGALSAEQVKSIGAVCCDHLVDSRIGHHDNVPAVLENKLVPVCDRARELGLKKIGIPLLDASSMDSRPNTLQEFTKAIVQVTDRYPNLTFSFEAELDHERLLALVNSRSNYRVTYDTGNITSYSNDHKEYLPAVFHKIDNVHLKDRLYDYTVGAWKTVWPGTGRTDFNLIFGMLKSLGYDGSYTLQLARGLDGLEQKTVEYQKYHMQALYERATQQGTK